MSWHVEIFTLTDEEKYTDERDAEDACERHERVSGARTRMFHVNDDEDEE